MVPALVLAVSLPGGTLSACAPPIATSPSRVLTDHRGHENDVYGAVFVPAASRVASCGQDRTLRLWDVKGPVTGLLPASGC